MQPFTIVQLDISAEAVKSVEDALQQFAAPETLDGYRTKGKTEVAASKLLKIQVGNHLWLVCSDDPFGRPGRSRGKATAVWGNFQQIGVVPGAPLNWHLLKGRGKEPFSAISNMSKSPSVCRHSQPEAGPGSPWQVSLLRPGV